MSSSNFIEFIEINTNYIPNDLNTIELDIHKINGYVSGMKIIDCDKDIKIYIGNNECMLKKGKHFINIYAYHAYHDFRISKNDFTNTKIYDVIYEKTNTFLNDMFNVILQYPKIIPNIYTNDGATFICKDGLSALINKNEIYKYRSLDIKCDIDLITKMEKQFGTIKIVRGDLH